MATELIAVLADIHAGSTVAVLPPGFVTSEGNPVEQNPIQEWLWRRFTDAKEFIDDVAGGDSFHLVVNGDAIDGNHHRTTQIISPDVADHVKAAVEILSPISAKAQRKFMIEGTECHTGNAEDALGDILGFEKRSGSNRHSFPRLDISIKGCPVTFFHHMPTSGRPWTASTPMGTVLAAEQLEAVRNGEEPPKVVCTAHSHVFRHFSDSRGMAVCSAPWQMASRFANKVVPWARTKPGVYLLDWRKRGFGELPELHFRTYAAPAPERIKL